MVQERQRVEWDEVGRRLLQSDYESSSLFAVTAQAGEQILASAALGPGQRALEIGCGRGDFLALAAARGVDIIGLDLAPEMVQLAKTRHPTLPALVGDGTALPFTDAQFDAVVCSFTLGFIEDRHQAVREAYRVLRSGGRYALTTWRLDQPGFLSFVERAVRRHGVGGEDAFLASNPGVRYYRELLAAAGFLDVGSNFLELTIRCPRAIGVLDILRTAGKARALVESQASAARQLIEEELVASMERRAGAYEMHMPAVLVQGTKP